MAKSYFLCYNYCMNNIENTQIAWMTGFYDGEGSISIAKYNAEFSKAKWGYNRSRYVIRVTVTNADKNSLIIFQEHFGGFIKSAACSQWILEGPKVTNFITAIYPYSVTKKDQLDIGKRFLDIPTISPGRKTERGLEIADFITGEYEKLYQELGKMPGRKGRKILEKEGIDANW